MMEFGRGFGLIAFIALLVLLLVFSVAITQPYISDTDPSTYIIVPMLMLPIFAVFMLKHSDKIKPKVEMKSIILGVVLFAAFIILILNMRGYLGPLFFSYRIDMLFMPLAILGLAALIFGIQNLRRFIWIAIYSVFASPLPLLPIINLNLGFASLNSLAIYYISGIFIHGITFSAPITLYLNSEAVSIGNTCIGIGALIGLVMFLVPIAYFLEGKLANKALWIASGLALMLILNFLRMLFITMAWFFYGPSESLLSLHSVAGQIIFYVVIVVMVLAAGLCRLTYPKLGLGKKHRYSAAGLSLATIFSVVYFLISMSYLNAASVSVYSLSANPVLSVGSISSLYGTYLSYNGNSYSIMGTDNSSVAFALQNSSNSSDIIIAIFGKRNASAIGSILSNKSTVGWKEYLTGSNTSFVYQLNSNTTIFLYHELVPYSQGSSSYVLDMYVAEPAANSTQSLQCVKAYAKFYDYLANIASLNPYTFDASIDNGYCMLRGVVR